MVNLTTIPDAELTHMVETTGVYMQKLENERDRREALANVESSLDSLLTRYLQASGVRPGGEWDGPSSAVDAYPCGWTVTHEGGLWESTVTGTIEEPGDGESWVHVGGDPLTPGAPGESVMVGDDVILSANDGEENESGSADDE